METLSDADFVGTRLAKKRDVAVVFAADWCGFCRRFKRDIAPKLETLPVPLVWGDVSDESSPLWEAFDVKVVPTLVYFRDGAPVWRKNGRLGLGLSKETLDELVKAAQTA
ncbi:MAG: thioredoxin family protein [Thermoplasmatota archaeon]